jgi:hypothetical protein
MYLLPACWHAARLPQGQPPAHAFQPMLLMLERLAATNQLPPLVPCAADAAALPDK